MTLVRTDNLRCLSVRQPWAWLLSHGIKRIENRPSCAGRSLVGCTVLIHACREPRTEEEKDAYLMDEALACSLHPDLPRSSELSYGAIVGAGRLVGHVEPDGSTRKLLRLSTADMRWWEPGSWGLVLDELRPVGPVPCRGRPGLWRPPDEVAKELLRPVLGRVAELPDGTKADG